MRPTTIAFVLAIATAAAGCSTFAGDDTSVVSSNPNSVTLKFREGHLEQATDRAQSLCAGQGRSARLQSVSPTGDNRRIGSFECI